MNGVPEASELMGLRTIPDMGIRNTGDEYAYRKDGAAIDITYTFSPFPRFSRLKIIATHTSRLGHAAP